MIKPSILSTLTGWLYLSESFSKIMDALGYKYRKKNWPPDSRRMGTRCEPGRSRRKATNLLASSELGLVIKREISMDKVAIEFKQVNLRLMYKQNLIRLKSITIELFQCRPKRALTLMAQGGSRSRTK